MAMTVRSEMATLIERVRLLIADPSGDTETFDDYDVQSFLDDTREAVNEEPLGYVWLSGQSLPTTFYSAFQRWDNATVLTDSAGATLTPTTSDPVAGRWTFSAGHAPAVYATGNIYDLHSAAASALEAWAAKLAREYDFSVDGGTYHRSQQREALLAQAREFRRNQRVAYARIVTGDA